MRINALKFETYGMIGDQRRETLREYLHRHRSTTGSFFRSVQRRINYGLTNAEWNALSYEQRDALRRKHDA